MISIRRRMTRRYLLSGIAGGAGMVALAACGTESMEQESGEAPQVETRIQETPQDSGPSTISTLMVLRGQNETWINSWLDIFANFEAQHPEYKLAVTDSAFASVTSKALTFMAAGFTFDAVYGFIDWLGLFADAGIIQSINPYLSTDTDVSMDDFHDFGVLRHRGIVYGLAWQLTAHPIWFNADRFQEAGLKTPAALEAEGNWTWEAVLDAALKLTRRGDSDITVGGLQVFPMFTSYLPYYAWAWGAELWDEGCTEASFTTPAFTDAVQYSVDLFTKHNVIGGTFLYGTQGMVERAPDAVRQFDEGIAARDLFSIGMAPRPRGPNGDRGTVMTPSAIHLGNGAKNADGAWTFLKYTVSAAAQPHLAVFGQGRFNANKHLAPLTLYPFENPAVYTQMAQDGRPEPQLLQQREFYAAWRATWDAMVEGSLPVADAMATTQEQVQGWINKGGCLG
ncbi:MAG: extracellular solute-binding protein [Chloroflexi bacterium]|nr:extracellular solute-binding protein [Chloroflexota bacterium]